MNLIEAIIKLLGHGFAAWELSQKNKYFDKYTKLKRRYYEEISKDRPDHATIDSISRELYELSEKVSADLSK